MNRVWYAESPPMAAAPLLSAAIVRCDATSLRCDRILGLVRHAMPLYLPRDAAINVSDGLIHVDSLPRSPSPPGRAYSERKACDTGRLYL